MVDVQTLTSTRNCATSGCPLDAEAHESYCRHCQEAAARPAATSSPSPLPALRDPLGLAVAADVDLATWTGLMRRLAAITSATRWWIGDLLVAGDFPEGRKYEIAEHELGLERSTLANYCYVARNVERERRRPELHFAHHVIVAPLEPAQQVFWLARAVDQKLTCLQLRAELGAAGLQAPVSAERRPAPQPPSPQPGLLIQSRLTVTWPAGLADRLRDTARARHVSMSGIVVEAVQQYLERSARST